MIRNDDVVVQVAALTVYVRRYYNIAVRRDTAGEFQTGEMCELNIEGVIFVEFIGMEILENMLRRGCRAISATVSWTNCIGVAFGVALTTLYAAARTSSLRIFSYVPYTAYTVAAPTLFVR